MLLFGVFVAVLVANTPLKTWHALVCILFGYYLAGSAMAPVVQQVMDALLSGLS